MSKPRIALALGDCAGIGPEIILKLLLDKKIRQASQFTIFGDVVPLKIHAELCHLPMTVEDDYVALHDGGENVPLISHGYLAGPNIAVGEINMATGRACYLYAKSAIKAVQAGIQDAVIAAPHTEAAVNAAGYRFAGYPTLLSEVTGVALENVYLMLLCSEYRVVNATLHVPLAQVPSMISEEAVLNTIRATYNVLQSGGTSDAKIGICGLNPHAGEGGLFGMEDENIIRPAVLKAKSEGINANGPHPADALFGAKAHDAYVVMYHDQGHIPVKVVAPHGASAISIGTPVLFGSVAHGSALDIAGTGRADPAALKQAVQNLSDLFGQRTHENLSEYSR